MRKLTVASSRRHLATRTSRRSLARHFIAAGAVVVALLAVGTSSPRAGGDPAMLGNFWQFRRVELDTSRSAPVVGVTVEREGMILNLTSGRVWLAKAFLGRVTGAYFIGEGTVSLTANGLVGNEMLRSTLRGTNFGVDFPGRIPKDVILRPRAGEKQFSEFKASVHEVFFRFSDGLEEQFEALMEEGGGDFEAAVTSYSARSKNLALVPPDEMAMFELENDFLIEVENDLDDRGFCVAEFKLGPGWLTYAFLGAQSQEVWIGTHTTAAGIQQDALTWTGYDRAADYDAGGHFVAEVEADHKPLLEMDHVKMDIDLESTDSLKIDATVTFTVLDRALTLVPFDFINNAGGYSWNDEKGHPVHLSSVADAAGNELPFMHSDDTVLVRLPQPATPGEEVSLRFVAAEEILVQVGGQSWGIISSIEWFPRHGYLGGRYTTDWTIRVKNPLSAVASGDLVETRTEGGATVSRWVNEQRAAIPSLIFGRFQSKEGTHKSITGDSITIGVHANPLGDLRGTTKSKSVLAEAQNILTLFEQLYGPYPYSRLDITQMAPFSGFGQAPPGILFLTGEAFLPSSMVVDLQHRASQRLRDEGAGGEGLMRSPYYHDFFAHELGHQWWGHRVQWGRDEDQWLSEAFTEYASALYAIQIDGENKFQEKLKVWRQASREADKCGFPIAGASLFQHRTATVANKCRTNLTYNKGAYVVHMLRMTIGHDKYVEAMKSFLTKHDGELVTTQMLQKEVEEVVGGSMGWFFDQWFYATGTPTFRFSYSTEQAEDGSYLLTGHITQDDPENLKQVLMPIFYDLGGKDPVVRNQVVLKVDHEFQIKLPSKPKRVWLDEFNTILGTIVNE